MPFSDGSSVKGAAVLESELRRGVNVVEFGATGDGTTDDSGAIQDAIDSLSTTGGKVFFPAGDYKLSAALTVTEQVPYEFAGEGLATRLKKGADNILLDLSGSTYSSDLTGSTHAYFTTVKDLWLWGAGDDTWVQPLMRLYYANNMALHNIYFSANYGEAIRAVEWWDSLVDNCRFVNCGGEGASRPAVHLLRSDNTVGNFGHAVAASTNNNITFRTCRWESFRDGGLWVLQGTGASGENQAIRLIDGCKFETFSYRGNVLDLRACRNMTIRDLFVYVGGFDAGFSTPGDAIYCSSMVDSQIDNVWGGHNTGSFVRHFINFDGGNGVVVRNVQLRDFGDITGSLVNIASSDFVNMEPRSIRYSLNSGTSPDLTGAPGIPLHWQGAGSPEGVIAAVVGSTYCRTDGGTGTTFYVKESGTGDTGWSDVA
jgi:hypothetical protein